ncbi:SurA N-terminal domain-containing protein [Sneathiella marina]|uniref:Parvulin-like PPIase n=1 Tax=Sneathiella marina TaxID=2950108 RepID=A0ABY4VXE7_9PROT|nr:SurA N-terminal domain-containing protein [Sneathiella marina]USG59593.1 SurA N-terminal domain-containing protein [Sneathiella marina]
MLHAMRKGASGWLAKGLLLLLVASFGVWGIGGDMLSSSVGSNVIEVGDKTVSIGEFQRDYQRNLNILSQRFQTQLTAEQARQFGLAQMTVNQIASRALIEEKTKSMGLSADDTAIREMIRSQPTFQNEFNQFDRFRFEQFLRQNGYSEGEYVEIVRHDIAGQQLINSMAIPAAATPKILVDTLYAYQAEKRSANYVEILDSTIEFAAIPSDDELKEYIANNPERFSAPEYRKLSYITLTPENFTEEGDISDADLTEEYEGRISEFNVPEQRGVSQMIFENEDQAKAALAKIGGGTTFAEIALSDLQLTPEDIDLGLMTQQDLLPELQGPVFDLQKDGISAPVKTVLGWHLVQVTEVSPETIKTKEQVREQLKKDIQLRKAFDVMYQEATKLEDEFAGGATLAEAGKTIGINVVTTDWIDSQGLDKQGQPVAGLPGGEAFLVEAFAKPTDSEAELSDSRPAGYYSVLVDEIAEAAVKPLADVKTAATKDWQNNWRNEQARKKADDLLVKINGGATLAQIASQEKVSVKSTAPVLRTGQSSELAPSVQAGLFDLQPAAYGVGANASGNGYVIYGIADIIPADAAADKDAAEQMATQVGSSIRASILTQYENYLQQEIGISVKEDLIREYF